ncbi:MAG: hypothetical protein DME78_01015 [Verrucomicrobia bacterium]|nr:MAG: hypothetical protein DME78_01015 [Verrucomicrobiota bacterium]
MNINAAAATTRKTAAKMRACVNARFLLIRRRVFIFFYLKLEFLFLTRFPEERVCYRHEK